MFNIAIHEPSLARTKQELYIYCALQCIDVRLLQILGHTFLLNISYWKTTASRSLGRGKIWQKKKPPSFSLFIDICVSLYYSTVLSCVKLNLRYTNKPIF